MFGAADRNDGSAYGWTDSTSTVTLPSSDLADGYLFLWGFEFHDTSNGRCNPQGRMVQASGTGNFESASTGGYNRDTSEDRSYVSGWSFVDNPSASSTFQFQWRRDADSPTGGTERAFIQVIPFYYSDIGLYSSTSTTATGGTTPTQITGFSGTDGTNITISSSQVSVTGDNKRYLCLGSGYHQGIGGSRTQRWYGFEIDGSFDHSAKGCMYYRNASNADGGESFIKLLETDTATRTIELNQYRGDGVAAGQGGADVDGNTTGANSAHAMVIIELNDNTEVFASVDSVGGQEFALTGPVDVDIASTGDIEFNDSASFTRSTDTGVNVEQDMDLFAFANVSHARESGSIASGSRWTVHGEFTVNGTENTDVGFHGNFNRGNQGSQDCHGSSCNQAGAFAVSTGDDFGVSNQELAGTEGGGGDIESQPDWVGFGLINLDTLEASSGTDDLLADDVESASEVTAPSIGQEHDLLANDVESASELTSPVIGQEHALTAVSVESASEVTTPALAEIHALTADDVESASEVTAPAIGQEHALGATDVESASEVSSPAVGQEHALLANDVESASEVSAPTLSESNILLADDVESATEVDTPSIGQEHALLADDVESASEATQPTIGQEHSLLADSVESASEVTTPTLTEVFGTDDLLADDVESSSEVSTPSVGQAHVLTAVSPESASEVTVPSPGQVHALTQGGVESTSEVSQPSIGQEHGLLADDVESVSEVTAPTVDGNTDNLLADDVEAQSDVSTPTLRLVDDVAYYGAGDNEGEEEFLLEVARAFLENAA